jgi:hypothetical protein
MNTVERMKNPLKNLEPIAISTEMASFKDVVDEFASVQDAKDSLSSDSDPWNNEENDLLSLESRIMQFVRERPGKSCNAIFKHFKKEGFRYTEISEAYNILLYDRKVLQRINAGTKIAPRYAHFSQDFFAYEPRKDVLYDVLGPL